MKHVKFYRIGWRHLHHVSKKLKVPFVGHFRKGRPFMIIIGTSGNGYLWNLAKGMIAADCCDNCDANDNAIWSDFSRKMTKMVINPTIVKHFFLLGSNHWSHPQLTVVTAGQNNSKFATVPAQDTNCHESRNIWLSIQVGCHAATTNWGRLQAARSFQERPSLDNSYTPL